MRNYNYKNKWQKLLTPEVVSLLTQIHEYKGEQTLFIEAKADALTQLVEIAKIQSTEASNKIEGIYTSEERLKSLVSNKTTPRTRNEQEIAGYRDVLATIHESHDFIPVKPSIILQLHRDLYKFSGKSIGGSYKGADNVIAEEDGTHKTPNYLDAGVTFISAKNIVNGELDFSDVKYISDQEYDEIQKRCQTEMGDILLSKSGSLGAPVIVKTTERIGLFESLAVIKYDRSKLLPAFLCEQLKSDRIQRQFKVGTKGVAIKHLHLGVIADTDIVVPPIEDQNAFAAFVEQTDKSKLEIQKSLEKLETLKKALMQKYFG